MSITRTRTRRSFRLASVLLLIAASRGTWAASSESKASAASVSDRYLDASARSAGDGSRARPFHDLRSALMGVRAGTTLHLATGLYAGPITVPDAVTLEGPVTVVVHAEAPDVVVTLTGSRSMLKGLTVQGGARGVECLGGGVLEGVHLSGQRELAIHAAGGPFILSHGVVEASVSQIPGLVLTGVAQATVKDTRFKGPFSTAIDAPLEGGRVELSDLNIDSAVRGVRVVQGEVVAQNVTLGRGRGDGFYTARAKARLDNVTVTGHEYGFTFTLDSDVQATGLRSIKADRAGLAIVRSAALLKNIRITEAGDFGGIQIVASRAWLENFQIEGAKDYGISARSSRVVFKDGTIADTSDPDGDTGDGIQLRYTKAQLRNVRVTHAANYALVVAEGSEVAVMGATFEGNGPATVVVETEARLDAASVTVRKGQGPALVVTKGAATLDRWHVEDIVRGNGGTIWAECGKGALVTVHDLREPSYSAVEALPSPCIAPGKALSLTPWTLPELLKPLPPPPVAPSPAP